MDKTERKQLIDKLEEDESFLSRYRCYSRVDKKKAWKQFCQQTRIPFYLRISRRQWIRYAALWILPIGMITALSLYRILPEEPALFYVEGMMSRIQNEATLTLADGTVVSLDSAANGLSLQQQTAEVMIASSQIKYQQASHKTQQTEYNTLSTNTDRKYDIVLEDGTHVYPNASSRLTYPLVFPADKRVVRLEGEAYFEIAKDARRPFFVETDRLKVQQYGTSFNLRNYRESPVEVVLIEGSVEVHTSGKHHMLKPGQLASYNAQGDTLRVQDVNTALYTAWHTGQVTFNECPLRDIVKVLSQWYSIQIEFADGQIEQELFTGRISRQENLLNILESLECTQDMSFAVKEGRIIISKRLKHE